VTPADRPALRSFGRIRSRTIKPAQSALMETLLPSLATPTTAFDPRTLDPRRAAAWLEIGFGGGEHLAGQASANPEALIIGAEPFLNGVASALRHIEANALANVRLHVGDARDLIALLPDASLDRVFILFPDPWPKARHRKRRLVQAAFVTELARVMKPGAMMRFATDWADYADQTLCLLHRDARFNWLAMQAQDWRTPPSDHVSTRYEQKRLGDCSPIWLEFQRTTA